jgi:hypothetical protein
MSTSAAVSPLSAGGSTVCAAAREVALEDAVERAFTGCRTPLALAALAVARGNVPDDAVVEAFDGCRTPLARAALGVARDEQEAPCKPPAKVNLTAQWVRDNYTSVYPMLVSHLSMKMPRSRELAVVEDHVQAALARMVERDTFAPFLRDGKAVKLSVLRIWAYQSASTELRRWGADASTRVTRGAKTSREVKAGKAWRVVQSANTAREVIRDREDPTTTADLHDPNEASPEDTLARKSRVDVVRRHLARIGKPHLVPAVDHLLDGGSLSDLDGGIAAQLTAALRTVRA